MTTASSNFYPDQYWNDDQKQIRHNYLPEQFADSTPIFEQIKALVKRGDFTLGEVVDEFERRFADRVGCQHGIGVGSGSDALFLALKALNIGPDDEVITTPYTFYATVSAIVRTGAKPVFVDIDDSYNLNPSLLEDAITQATKAVLPVHWSGRPCDMHAIQAITQPLDIHLVADACHGIDSTYHNEAIGKWADISCFSLHPLKNLNVWGDGGVVTTNNKEIAKKISLLRNHGLSDRDTCEIFAYNSRLDSIQAIVGLHLLDTQLNITTQARQAHATFLNEALSELNAICLPPELKHATSVYHLYMAEFQQRDALKAFLNKQGIDAKIHYPTPLHLQPAAKALGYKIGDFPRAEHLAANCLSLPVHEFVDAQDLKFMVQQITNFYHL